MRLAAASLLSLVVASVEQAPALLRDGRAARLERASLEVVRVTLLAARIRGNPPAQTIVSL